MSTKSIQLRVPQALHARLRFVAQVAERSMNSVMSEAIEAYLPLLAARLERELSVTLQRLRAYAADDENASRDWEAFIQAEAEQDDPAEGTRAADAPSGGTSEAAKLMEDALARLG